MLRVDPGYEGTRAAYRPQTYFGAETERNALCLPTHVHFVPVIICRTCWKSEATLYCMRSLAAHQITVPSQGWRLNL